MRLYDIEQRSNIIWLHFKRMTLGGVLDIGCSGAGLEQRDWSEGACDSAEEGGQWL